jgi:hypothetical protein
MEEVMTELQSPQRRSFTAKAIFGLLLAVVMVGTFATAGSAENTGTPRSGWLHVTKECSLYSGKAGGFCTITGSNLNAISPFTTTVVYASALAFPTLNSDVVLDGPGNNDAHGHVVLDLNSFTGWVTFSGGTGQLSGFHAIAFVDCRPTGSPCAWNGLYRFSPPGHDR